VSSGQWAEAQSLELSRKNFEELLPQGTRYTENYLFDVLDDQGTSVGTLWIGVKEYAARCRLHLRHMESRRLFGVEGTRSALSWQRRKKRETSAISGIGLHVFGHNSGAPGPIRGARLLRTNHQYVQDVVVQKSAEPV